MLQEKQKPLRSPRCSKLLTFIAGCSMGPITIDGQTVAISSSPFQHTPKLESLLLFSPGDDSSGNNLRNAVKTE